MRGVLGDISGQAVLNGALAAFIGSASSFAIILAGLKAVGATPDQAATGLMVAFVLMGLAGIISAIASRLPIGVAWSTPGAALLGASAVPAGGFAVVIGALLVCALLLIVAGLVRPFGRMIERIPRALAAAMIAGVLVQFCFAPFVALGQAPLVVGVMLGVWAVVMVFARLWAVPATIVAFALLVAFVVPREPLAAQIEWIAPLVWVAPQFSVEGVVGLGVPLFIVTMAGQNIPGIAVMRANDYPIKAAPWFTLTGAFSALGAPFGAIPVNLAAITAAMMAGEQSHAQPTRRYWAAIAAGATYMVFGVFSGGIVALATLVPLFLVQTIAGLALVPALIAGLGGALSEPQARESAIVTFLFGASGTSLFGISGAFWGLVVGLALYGLQRRVGR